MTINAIRLREVLSYNPGTGLFTRIAKTGKKGIIGQVVGSLNADGYVMIGIDGCTYYGHRLAFLYMTDACPSLVDHINQDKSCNIWANLRDASKSLNAINSKQNQRNSSGLRGVSWHAGGNKWQAHCGPKYLGLFETKEAAHAAYSIAAEEQLCSAI